MRYRSIVLAASAVIVLGLCLAILIIRSAKAASPVPPTANSDPFPTLYNSEPDKTGPMPAAFSARARCIKLKCP